MERIHAAQLIDLKKLNKVFILDVRMPDEFASCHVPGAVNIPLSYIEEGKRASIPRHEPVYLICKSGLRSDRARKILEASGYNQVVCVEGGMQECSKIEGATVMFRRTLPLMRQVQLVAGLLVVFGILGSLFIHPAFKFLSLFVGCGLTFAGLTGFCGMASLLEKMPWNKI